MKTLKIEEKLHLRLKVLAVQLGVSMQDMIESYLKEGLEKDIEDEKLIRETHQKMMQTRNRGK